MFEKDEYGVTQIKRKYVHNTMNFFNAYEKNLDEQLGLMAESLDSLSKYRELIQTFYKEYEKDKREKTTVNFVKRIFICIFALQTRN